MNGAAVSSQFFSPRDTNVPFTYSHPRAALTVDCVVFGLDERDLQLLLIQRDGERYLIEGRCPHRGHPLDVATLERGVIQCALHHYRFAIGDGRLLHATEEPCRGLRTFELVYEGNELGVMLEEC